MKKEFIQILLSFLLVFSTLGESDIRKRSISVEEVETSQEVTELNETASPAQTGGYWHQPLFNSISIEFGLTKILHYFKVREPSHREPITLHKPSYFFLRTGPPLLPA